jgi:NADPH2:quinone reductase
MAVFGAAGGVGLTAVQLGRLAGLKVIAIAGSQARVDLALAHGAHAGLVHGGGDLGARIKALNGGQGVDIVYDPVGGDLFPEALRCLRPEGRVLVIGFASGEIPQIPANLLLVKNIDVIGFNFGLYIGWGLTDERETYRERLAAMVRTLFEAIASGDLSPPPSAVFPLERFAEAFDSVVERRAVGRVVLRIGAAA